MDWRIRSIVVETTDNLNVDTDALIDRLCSLSTRLCDRISSDSNVLLTPRLVHGDPHDRNCLVDNGRFSGLVDWEVCTRFYVTYLFLLARRFPLMIFIFQSHYILPTCLAAEYPPYIRYDGMREQRYAALNEYGDIEFMNSHMVVCLHSSLTLRLRLRLSPDSYPITAPIDRRSHSPTSSHT